MDMSHDGKVAVVCASSAGIGKGIAKKLAIEGAHIVLLARGEDRLKNAYKEIQEISKREVFYFPCDLSESAQIKQTFKKIESAAGGVDILINNQGGPAPGSIEDLLAEDLDMAIKTNIESVFHITKLCLPYMKKKKWGRIINILSVSGKQPLPNMLLSNMVRPAILGFAKTLANEYGPFGITINSLLPANVLSDRTNSLLSQRAEKEKKSMEDLIHECSQGVPLKRMVHPDEFAEMASFLACEKGSFITGTAISIDGGLSGSLL